MNTNKLDFLFLIYIFISSPIKILKGKTNRIRRVNSEYIIKIHHPVYFIFLKCQSVFLMTLLDNMNCFWLRISSETGVHDFDQNVRWNLGKTIAVLWWSLLNPQMENKPLFHFFKKKTWNQSRIHYHDVVEPVKQNNNFIQKN